MKLALILSCLVAPMSPAASAEPLEVLPPVPPPIIDPYSEESHQQRAEALELARQAAVASNPVVRRQFLVRFEQHYGFFLEPVGGGETIVMPDFPDLEVLAEFSRNFHSATTSSLGQTLLCDCTGIAWEHYSTDRFVIQSYELTPSDQTPE